jgi:hypothetical protein
MIMMQCQQQKAGARIKDNQRYQIKRYFADQLV